MAERTCTVPDCFKPLKSRGMCSAHYAAASTKAKPDCSVPGCDKRAGATRGWCAMHYQRWRQTGTHGAAPKATEAERFFDFVTFGDCWTWTGGTSERGYGKFHASGGRLVLAHRWVWAHLVGPIPDGLVIDHLCRNTSCVNPDHLEPVTQAVNVHRAVRSHRKES